MVYSPLPPFTFFSVEIFYLSCIDKIIVVKINTVDAAIVNLSKFFSTIVAPAIAPDPAPPPKRSDKPPPFPE